MGLIVKAVTGWCIGPQGGSILNMFEIGQRQ